MNNNLNTAGNAEKYDYYEAMHEYAKEEILNWMEWNEIQPDELGNRRGDIIEYLIIQTNITGNLVGSYTCDARTAERYLLQNADLARMALAEHGCSEQVMITNPERADVLVRMHVLPIVVKNVVSEIEDEMEETEEERKAKLIHDLEELGWQVNAEDDTSWELETWSNLGEDLVYYVSGDTVQDLYEDFDNQATEFDPDEHAEEWFRLHLEDKENKHKIPSSMRDLLEDADWIAEFLMKTANVFYEYTEYGSKK